MPWAQELVEAEGLSVVSLTGFINWWVLAGCDWGLGSCRPWIQLGWEFSSVWLFPGIRKDFSSSPPAFPSLQIQQQGGSVLFHSYKESFFLHLPFSADPFFFWMLLLFLGAPHNRRPR